MSKQARMEGVDRISNLPDPVLTLILSFLPTKEAVRTSILSTRWVKVFTLVSNLIFDDHGKPRQSVNQSFMNFVDRVLFYRRGDVDKFHLKFVGFVDYYRVDGWIRYVLSNRVREIVLQLMSKKFDRLPLGIFSCKTLEVLKLDIDSLRTSIGKIALNVPVKSCSPSLKILHLRGFKFPDDGSARRLFSICLVLEELSVEECILSRKFHVSIPTLKRLTISFKFTMSTMSECVIDAPSLVCLKCHCLPRSFLLKNLNSLVEAYINCSISLCLDDNFALYNNAANALFKGIRNAQSLHLSCVFNQAYQGVCTLIGELPKVTYLNLEASLDTVWWEIELSDLLLSFPCLEALDIEVDGYDFNRNMLPSKGFPSFVLSQLKKIQILSFKGKKYEFNMIEYFMKNAKKLENLTVQTSEEYWMSMIDKNLLIKVSEKYELVSVV